MGAHINADGDFQSDKYPTCPAGKVPLSVRDATAQDLLWEYAQRRRSVDAEFAADLEAALLAKGYSPPAPIPAAAEQRWARTLILLRTWGPVVVLILLVILAGLR